MVLCQMCLLLSARPALAQKSRPTYYRCRLSESAGLLLRARASCPWRFCSFVTRRQWRARRHGQLPCVAHAAVPQVGVAADCCDITMPQCSPMLCFQQRAPRREAGFAVVSIACYLTRPNVALHQWLVGGGLLRYAAVDRHYTAVAAD